MSYKLLHVLKSDLVVPAGTVVQVVFPMDGSEPRFIVPTGFSPSESLSFPCLLVDETVVCV